MESSKLILSNVFGMYLYVSKTGSLKGFLLEIALTLIPCISIPPDLEKLGKY